MVDKDQLEKPLILRMKRASQVLVANRMRNSKRHLLEIRLSLPFQESDDAFLI